jgi:hypothetical protein
MAPYVNFYYTPGTQYFQPGAVNLPQTNDPGKWQTPCPFCSGTARMIGSSYAAWRCGDCGKQFQWSFTNVNGPLTPQDDIPITAITMGDANPPWPVNP